MSYTISEKNSITLTRGDSFIAHVEIYDPNGEDFVPEEGSEVRFALKKDYTDFRPILVVNIPIDTMILELKPCQTKPLDFGKYVYDIQLTTSQGLVDTFIKGRMTLTEEVV